jgi:hypothetical protein
MSFMLTTAQMRAGTKTVTRRLGWWFLNPGDLIMAVEKSRGRRKGEQMARIAPIRIVSTRAELLNRITVEEVRREGFYEMSPADFINHFCATHRSCTPQTRVNRIAFEFV